MSKAGAGVVHCLSVSVSQVISPSPTTVNPFPFGMQTLPLKTPRVCRSPRSRRGGRYDQFKVIKSEACFGIELSLSLGKVPRRLLVGISGLIPSITIGFPGFTLPMFDMKEPEIISTVDQFCGESMPVTLPLDESLIIRGLKEVLIGMRVGGKRRALIPPSAGYIAKNLQPIPEFGPR